MGACSSCLRLLLDAESDVKIHVIEPTSINGGDGPSIATVTREPTAGNASATASPPRTATLQVPGAQRVKTPSQELTDQDDF